MDWRDARISPRVNPGWEPLVDELHARVLEIAPDVVVEQVKEKFGQLRYYFTANDEGARSRINALVDEFARRSGQTCEVCGGPGEPVDRFNQFAWSTTLCERHARVRRETGKAGRAPITASASVL